MTTIYTAIVFVLLNSGQVEMVRVGPFQDEASCVAGAAVLAQIAVKNEVLPVAHACVKRTVLPEGVRWDV